MMRITAEIKNSWNNTKRAETPYFHCIRYQMFKLVILKIVMWVILVIIIAITKIMLFIVIIISVNSSM